MFTFKQINFRSLLTSLLVIFFLPASVLAMNVTWQSPYAGIDLGGGFGSNHVSTNTGSVADTSYFATSDDINAVNYAGKWANNPSTMIVGIQAGHDWTFKKMVYGIVLDYNTLHFSSSKTLNHIYPNNPDQYSIRTAMQTNWLFTLRARLGYQIVTSIPSLFYFTGGMALTQLKVSNHFNDDTAFAGLGGNTTSKNQIGFGCGAGIEVAVLQHTTVAFEYLYVSMPSIRTIGFVSNTEGGFGIPTRSLTSPFNTSASFYANLIKIALNYRFDE